MADFDSPDAVVSMEIANVAQALLAEDSADESAEDPELRSMARTRSMPSLMALDSEHAWGEQELTDRYELSERRKLEIISRYDPPGTTIDQIRSRYARTRNRTWRAANLKRMKANREKLRSSEELRRYPSVPLGIFDPSRGRYRWILLFFCSFISCAVWMQYDSVGALGDEFRNHTKTGIDGGLIVLTETQLGILDSVYSIPNCVLVLFGGIIIDRMGLRFALLTFMGIVLAGGVLMNVALIVNKFWMIVVSRVVFGIGGESLYVAQDAFTSYWFEGRDLAFALAITTVVGRLSDIATFAGFPLIGLRIGIRGAMYVMTGVCVLSFLSTVMVSWMDKRAETYSFEGEREVIVREDYSVRSVLQFSKQFWLAAILTMVFYSSVLPFQNLCPKYLEATYNIKSDVSGYYTAIISAVSVIVSPILGLSLDRWGYRIYLIQIGLVLNMIAYAFFLIPGITTPVPSLILLGMSFSIVPAAIWPSLVLLVDQAHFGTAYGIMEALINVGNTSMYYGIGVLLQADNYFVALLIFMLMNIAGFFLSVAWLTLDLKTGNWCNLPSAVQVQPNPDERPDKIQKKQHEKSRYREAESEPLLINDSFAALSEHK